MLLVQDILNASDIPLTLRRGLETRVQIILFPLTVDIPKPPSLKINCIYHE